MKTSSLSIVLTSDYFKILLEKVHETFMNKHRLVKLPKALQLYGYGTFNDDKPSLKKDFEAIGSEFINGKYLYDKSRAFEKGQPIIKINQHYKDIILHYIGYDDFKHFLEDHKVSSIEYEKQYDLIYSGEEDKTYYYLNYYFGEHNKILKGQTIISNNWKTIQHIFIYPLEDGTYREHYSNGSIKRQGDTITIKTSTLSGGRYIDGASEIYYIGHKSPSHLNYLIGTYCTFDIYTNTVAGRSILEKCESKKVMEEQSKTAFIPPYIALEIRNKRIVNNRFVPRNALELSDHSPYASLYGKLPGTYELIFRFDEGFKETLKFKILETDYQVVTLTENVYIEKDKLELLNKGSIVNFRFSFSGIIALDSVSIFFKTYFLRNENEKQEGVFSGIDNENRLINGTLVVNYAPN
ncbi:hypothetical protein A8C32_03460 [Flavivirga aquatica]|uniref:Uncharacterized protein n=1 Tax=Flavivirga aquatica TaxID=1849968 RepID=A0A1E5TAX4_9FLAO|nr:hypothetical protein [Flavivirga aquatica]OEK08523.1 hypothetical protein A8C32_03460 [Flavivirga aquatica]